MDGINAMFDVDLSGPVLGRENNVSFLKVAGWGEFGI